MSNKKNNVLVGVFVITSIIIAIMMILALGASDLLREKNEFVLYFEGDMSGLGPGAPVVYHGVKIGEVKDIRIVLDEKLRPSVPVIIELESKALGTPSEEITIFKEDRTDIFLRRGLCAQLVTESFVTGKLMIKLDFVKDRSKYLHGHNGEEVEIPTVPSDLALLQESIKDLPIKTLFTSLVSSLEGIDKKVNSKELGESMINLNQSLANLERLLKNSDEQVTKLGSETSDTLNAAKTLINNLNNKADQLTTTINKTLGGVDNLTASLDKEVKSNGPELHKLSTNASTAIQEVEATVAQYKKLIDPNSPLYNGVLTTLDKFARAAKSIEALTAYLERHPESILHGKRDNE